MCYKDFSSSSTACAICVYEHTLLRARNFFLIAHSCSVVMRCGLVLSEEEMSDASGHVHNHKKNYCISELNQAVTEACRPFFKSIPDSFHIYRIFPPCDAWTRFRVMISIHATSLPHLRHTTLGRTPLDKWSARRRDLYLTTHNTHQRERDINVPDGIRTHNPCKRAAADPRLRLRGHRHWLIVFYTTKEL